VLIKKDSVELKHHCSIWGTMNPRTTKRKYCQTFYAKMKSVIRLPKDTAPIKWTGRETQPHHHGQGSLHAYRCKLDTQALALCCTLCSAHLQ
jgi:hypothetical protein